MNEESYFDEDVSPIVHRGLDSIARIAGEKVGASFDGMQTDVPPYPDKYQFTMQSGINQGNSFLVENLDDLLAKVSSFSPKVTAKNGSDFFEINVIKGDDSITLREDMEQSKLIVNGDVFMETFDDSSAEEFFQDMTGLNEYILNKLIGNGQKRWKRKKLKDDD